MELTANKKKIITMLADGQFHSGTAISEQLQLSRSAIWKQLNFLNALGIEFTAVSGKGYRLNQAIELFDQHIIEEQLSADSKAKIAQLEIHDHIESTNLYLNQQVQNEAPTGFVCLAEYQSAGKGRRGRQWVSPFGSNIYLSLLWRYACGPAAISALSLVIGLAVVRVLKQQGFADVGLKWPNDIYWQAKKLGGILVEVSGESEGPCAVVIGLGLNVFLPEKEATTITQDWTDLSRISADKSVPSRNKLVAEIINAMIEIVDGFDEQGIGPFIEEWRSFDCMQGKQVTLHLGKQHIQAEVAGVDDMGLLKLKHADGSIGVYSSGEVSFSNAIV